MDKVKISSYGGSTRKVNPKPEGQKFGVGEEVYIRPIYEASMGHFNCDVLTAVEYSYAQAFGDGGASSSYSTEIGAWYEEDQLMAVEGRTLEECRRACEEYFGKSYQDMLDMRNHAIENNTVRVFLRSTCTDDTNQKESK